MYIIGVAVVRGGPKREGKAVVLVTVGGFGLKSLNG